jgi:hypothetical protein
VHDAARAEALLQPLKNGALVIADKGYDADSIRANIRSHGAIPNIPNRSISFDWARSISLIGIKRELVCQKKSKSQTPNVNCNF